MVGSIDPHSLPIEKLRNDLVFYSGFDTKREEPIVAFKRDANSTILPRVWSDNLGCRRQASVETAGVSYPKMPTARNADQQKFWMDLVTSVTLFKTSIGCAQTGSGKTVGGLFVAAHFGHTTLIIVHMAKLAHQWRDEIHDKLGVPLEDIGFVGDEEMNWKGKKICVAMLQTLRNGSMPPEFFEQFTFTIIDELHRIAAPASSEVLFMLRSKYILGLSATVERKDGLHALFHAHLGPVRVVSKQKSLPVKVHVVKYSNPEHRWVLEGHVTRAGKKLSKMEADSINLKVLEADEDRNAKLVYLIQQIYAKNRNAIIVGEHIDHLWYIRKLVVATGAKASEVGMFTAQYLDAEGKRRKPKAEELRFAKEDAKLCFATYGMLTEGIDEPRWDCGLDITPRASATQLVGRIRRELDGKPVPMWITLLDTNCPLGDRFYGRMRDYTTIEAEVTGL